MRRFLNWLGRDDRAYDVGVAVATLLALAAAILAVTYGGA